MKKTLRKRALPARRNAGKPAPPPRPIPPPAPPITHPASDPLLAEMHRLDVEHAAQLQQTLTAGQYSRCQGERQQRMARNKPVARR
jgi:hypothetical protein